MLLAPSSVYVVVRNLGYLRDLGTKRNACGLRLFSKFILKHLRTATDGPPVTQHKQGLFIRTVHLVLPIGMTAWRPGITVAGFALVLAALQSRHGVWWGTVETVSTVARKRNL